MENGESMNRLEVTDIRDILNNLITKLDYLTTAHYGFLGYIQDAGQITDNEKHGFIEVHESLIAELRVFENGLSPHVTTLWELKKASKKT